MVKKYVKDEYIDQAFGFDVILKNVPMCEDKAYGDYPLIDYGALKKQVMDELINSKSKLTGAKFDFLRKCQKKSLREIAEILSVSHTEIKNWELDTEGLTGMDDKQERLFRLECAKFLRNERDEQFNKFIIEVDFNPEREIVNLSEKKKYNKDTSDTKVKKAS